MHWSAPVSSVTSLCSPNKVKHPFHMVSRDKVLDCLEMHSETNRLSRWPLRVG
jgi:hypothetical protein